MASLDGRVIVLERLQAKGINVEELSSSFSSEYFTALISLPVDHITSYTLAIGAVRISLLSIMSLTPNLESLKSQFNRDDLVLSLVWEDRRISLQFVSREVLESWHAAISDALADTLICALYCNAKNNSVSLEQVLGALERMSGLVDATNQHLLRLQSILKVKTRMKELVITISRSSQVSHRELVSEVLAEARLEPLLLVDAHFKLLEAVLSGNSKNNSSKSSADSPTKRTPALRRTHSSPDKASLLSLRSPPRAPSSPNLLPCSTPTAPFATATPAKTASPDENRQPAGTTEPPNPIVKPSLAVNSPARTPCRDVINIDPSMAPVSTITKPTSTPAAVTVDTPLTAVTPTRSVLNHSCESWDTVIQFVPHTPELSPPPRSADFTSVVTPLKSTSASRAADTEAPVAALRNGSLRSYLTLLLVSLLLLLGGVHFSPLDNSGSSGLALVPYAGPTAAPAVCEPMTMMPSQAQEASSPEVVVVVVKEPVTLESVRRDYAAALKEWEAAGRVSTSGLASGIEVKITIGRPKKLSTAVRQGKERLRARLGSVWRGLVGVVRGVFGVSSSRRRRSDSFDVPV